MKKTASKREKLNCDGITERFMDLLKPLKGNIKEVYLFGSRCRDDWRPDSDYDFLIIVDKKERDVISRLYDAVMDILLDTGRLISLKVFSLSEFNRLKSIPSPFICNVLNDGVRLGNYFQRTH